MTNIINKIGQYRSAGWADRDVSKITQIVVHHSAYRQDNQSDDARLNQLQSWHEANGWAGLSYHFVITKGGQIYQINGIEELTWTDYSNYDSVSVLVDGYFHDNKDKPTVEQLQSLEYILNELANNHPEFPASQNDVKAHREVAATIKNGGTACCGDELYDYVVEFRNTGKIKTGLEQPIDWNLPNFEKSLGILQASGKFDLAPFKDNQTLIAAFQSSKDLDYIGFEFVQRHRSYLELKSLYDNLQLDLLTLKNQPKPVIDKGLSTEDKSLINGQDKAKSTLNFIQGWVKNNISVITTTLGGYGVLISQDQTSQIANGLFMGAGFLVSLYFEIKNRK
jgi:hypothetical protein